jgi:hypothetical protein
MLDRNKINVELKIKQKKKKKLFFKRIMNFKNREKKAFLKRKIIFNK